MSRTTTLVFAALALFLVLFPLSLAKPGLPLTLKGDEPAYYLMALSLVHDRDLVCEVKDIQRLGVEFPYNDAKNLILGSPDDWRTVYFGKPYLVSLLAAPMTALFGANGFVAMNMALLLFSAWLGALWLRQWNSETTSLLFSIGFFLLSNAFAYVFWLHTEVLCVASTTAALYFGLAPARGAPVSGRWGRVRARLATDGARLAISGAALIFGAYNKPYLALLALPVVVRAVRKRGLGGAMGWAAGAGIATVVICGLSIALIGRPTPYLGLSRTSVSVDFFDRMPDLPAPPTDEPKPSGGETRAASSAVGALSAAAAPEAEAKAAAADHGATSDGEAPDRSLATNPAPADATAPQSGATNSFNWIFESFKVDANTLPNLGYFFVGRHTGLFPYAPFSLLAVCLFFFRGPRDLERWLLLASLLGIALYSLTFIWFNWHGGGGFVGNRYFVNALPGFLFLVGKIAPEWLTLVGYSLGGLFVGGIFFTPFGANVEAPTLQAHTRNLPFRFLPFEQSLAPQIPGYRGLPGGAGSYLSGRADLFRPIGDALWVVGGQKVELELKTPAPIARPVFEVATFIAPNRVVLGLGGARSVMEFASAEPPGNVTRVVLDHPKAESRLVWSGERIAVYDLSVKADRQVWRDEEVLFRESKKGPRAKQAPPPALAAPDWEKSEIHALVGASISYLGEEAELDADPYAVEWTEVAIPRTWPVKRIAALPIKIRNASQVVWRANGATAIAVSYHWLRPDGRRVQWEGLRCPLPEDVEPGKTTDVTLEVETPAELGTYLLVLDLVRERIAWFSDRHERQTLTRDVTIVPAEGRYPAAMSTARGLLRSGSAATVAQLVRIVALQATHIVVRRLVPPDEMGIWSWLEVVFLLLATVRDLGLPSHVVRLRPMPLGTLTRVELGWGAILGSSVLLGAPWIAQLFHEPSAAVVAGLRALVVYLLLEGLAAVALTWYEARLEIERSLPAELARTVAYCAIVLAAASSGWGFWSFVVAQIGAQALFVALLWWSAKDGIELVHVPGSTAALLEKSLPVGLVWLLAAGVTYADLFVVGRLFEREAVGLYAFGYGYAFLVTRILQQPIGRSLYPALVALDGDRAEQFRAYRLATVLFLALEVPAALFLAANAAIVTRILTLGSASWAGAAVFLQLLAFAPVVDPLGRFGGELLLARHADRARLLSLALQLAVLVGGGVALSLALGSPFGMAWANFAPVGSLVVMAVLVRAGIGRELARLGRDLAEVYLLPLPLFALAFFTTGGHPWLRFAATSAALALALGWAWRRHRAELREFFRADAPA